MLGNKIKGLREILWFDNWIEIAAHHVFRRPDQLAVYRFRGLEAVFLRSGGDANGLRRCVSTSQYTQFLSAMQLRGKLRIADLGAHTGGFIFWAFSRGLDVVESVSVEPNIQTFARLDFNLRYNFGASRCRAVNAGIWSHDCELETTGGAGDTGSTVSASGEGSANEETVPGITINEVFASFDGDGDIDICKLDIEGSEWRVLAHPQTCDALRHRCRNLIIEIHPGDETPDTLLERLKSMGFEVIRKCAEGDQTWLLRNAPLETRKAKT